MHTYNTTASVEVLDALDTQWEGNGRVTGGPWDGRRAFMHEHVTFAFVFKWKLSACEPSPSASEMTHELLPVILPEGNEKVMRR